MLQRWYLTALDDPNAVLASTETGVDLMRSSGTEQDGRIATDSARWSGLCYMLG